MPDFEMSRMSHDDAEEKDSMLPPDQFQGLNDNEAYDDVQRTRDYTSLPRQFLALAVNIQWRTALQTFARFLIPSFWQGPEVRAKIWPARMHPTAYLDGLRGVAAFTVYLSHYSLDFYAIDFGWGADGKMYDFLRLPYIRLPFQGAPAVAIFFVISGYALSYRPIRLMRSGQTLDFYQSLTSTLFRRYLRLFLPTLASTFLIVIALRVGLYEVTREFAMDRTYVRGTQEPHPHRMSTSSKQLWHWAGQQWLICKEFVWHKNKGYVGTYYDRHLWTIPVEFRNSLYLFLTILGTARLRTRFRFMLVALVMAHAYTSSRWDLMLFLSGMILAELDHIRGAHAPPSALPNHGGSTKNSRKWTLFWYFVAFISLYLMSQPSIKCKTTPGWRTLCNAIPSWWEESEFRYYQAPGAALFVAATARLRPLQRILETSVIQYLGKISFSLYLMHALQIHTYGYMCDEFIFKKVTGIEGNNFHVGFALSLCFSIPAVIWMSDVFWRAVDMPSVKFAKWLEGSVNEKAD